MPFIRLNIFPIILVLFSIFLGYKSYTPATFLTGWDTLHPEFNYRLYWNRIIDGVWQEHQGLGAVAAQAHAAEIPRVAVLMLLDLFLPMNAVRYAYVFLMLLLGPLGVYALIKRLVKNDTAAFAGGLFYLLNLATLQHFYVPLEMFLTQYAALGWLFLLAIKYVEEDGVRRKKNLLLFVLVTFFAVPQAHTPTLFFAYLMGLIVFLSAWSLSSLALMSSRASILSSLALMSSRASARDLAQRREISRLRLEMTKKMIVIIGVTLLVNSFWLLPNLYFVVKHGADISKSKIHRLFSQEAFLQNRQFGSIKDAALLKGFLFNWGEYVGDGQFGQLLDEWQTHLKRPIVEPIGYVAFGLVFVGAVLAVVRREKFALPILAVLLLSLFFFMNANPPAGAAFEFLQEKVPLFREAFRFPFTKFSILLMLSYAVFFGYAVGMIEVVGAGRAARALRPILALIITAALIYYMLPAFRGNLISPSMKVEIPQRYFEMFRFFGSQDKNGRVADFPIHSFWGWSYYDWGYQGAGFLWFGIKQPLLNREFDRWSPYNEQYYSETSYAVYSGDAALFEKVLSKYSVRWIILDESIIAPGSDPKILFFSQIKELLKDNARITLERDFGGGLYVYRVVGAPLAAKRITDDFAYAGPTFFKEPYDPIFNQLGNYVVQNAAFSFVGMASLDENIRLELAHSDDYGVTIRAAASVNGAFVKPIEAVVADLYAKNSADGLLTFTLADDIYSENNISFTLKRPSVSSSRAPARDPAKAFVLKIGDEVIPLGVERISQTNIGSVFVKEGERLNVSLYEAREDVGVSKIEYVGVLENCGESVEAAAYQLARLDDGFELSARGTIACVTAPLSAFIKTVPAAGDVMVGADYLAEEKNSKADFCILDSKTGLCINTGTFAVIEYKDVSNYFVRFYAREGAVSYRNIRWFASSPSQELTVDSKRLFSPSVLPKSGALTFKRDFRFFAKDIFDRGKPTNCKNGLPTVAEKLENGGSQYVSKGASICDSISFPTASHRSGYIVEVASRNIEGMPLRMCVTNEVSKRCDLYVSLVSDKYGKSFYLLPPMGEGSGYTFNFTNLVFGSGRAVNELSSVALIPIPYKYIKGFNSDDVKKGAGELLIHNQAYEDGWIALCGFKLCGAKHVLVNNWANGWIFENGEVPQNIRIIFWPQMLEYVGLALTVGTFAFSALSSLAFRHLEPSERSVINATRLRR